MKEKQSYLTKYCNVFVVDLDECLDSYFSSLVNVRGAIPLANSE